jgi:cysteine synthase B
MNTYATQRSLPTLSLAPDLPGSIGDTPLLTLRRLAPDLPDTVSICAKAEFLNPGGSVKARSALRLVSEGLASGRLGPHRSLIDATSGNTGIAYAMLGAVMNFRVKLVMPSNASAARKQIVRAYGAELVLTDPQEMTDGAQNYVQETVRQNPDRYFYPDQYNNEANWLAHFDTTGPEILEQTDGRITHFVTVLGTTGTFVGVSRRLKKEMPSVNCIAVQPDGPLHGIEGAKHLESSRVPGIYDPLLVQELLRVTTEEAREMTRRLAREEGLMVGVSSGANVAAALRVARRIEAGLVVTVLCDSGAHYLGEDLWSEPARSNGREVA